jgi:hypothetical protein
LNTRERWYFQPYTLFLSTSSLLDSKTFDSRGNLVPNDTVFPIDEEEEDEEDGETSPDGGGT